jgi:hypothetical protein
MSRKKQRRQIVTTKSPGPIKESGKEAVKQVAPIVPPTPKAPEGALVAPSAEGMPLLAEVQSFIQRREELARKLADEIAATETRLAELKKTAAALFPETSAPVSAPKDKKPKKLVRAKALPSKAAVSVESADLPAEVIPTNAEQSA